MECPGSVSGMVDASCSTPAVGESERVAREQGDGVGGGQEKEMTSEEQPAAFQEATAESEGITSLPPKPEEVQEGLEEPGIPKGSEEDCKEAFRNFLHLHRLSSLLDRLEKEKLPSTIWTDATVFCRSDGEFEDKFDFCQSAFEHDEESLDELFKARRWAELAFQVSWDFQACRDFLERHGLLSTEVLARLDQMSPWSFRSFHSPEWGEKEKFSFCEALFHEDSELVKQLSEKREGVRKFNLNDFGVEREGAWRSDRADFVSCRDFLLSHNLEGLLERLEGMGLCKTIGFRENRRDKSRWEAVKDGLDFVAFVLADEVETREGTLSVVSLSPDVDSMLQDVKAIWTEKVKATAEGALMKRLLSASRCEAEINEKGEGKDVLECRDFLERHKAAFIVGCLNMNQISSAAFEGFANVSSEHERFSFCRDRISRPLGSRTHIEFMTAGDIAAVLSVHFPHCGKKDVAFFPKYLDFDVGSLSFMQFHSLLMESREGREEMENLLKGVQNRRSYPFTHGCEWSPLKSWDGPFDARKTDMEGKLVCFVVDREEPACVFGLDGPCFCFLACVREAPCPAGSRDAFLPGMSLRDLGFDPQRHAIQIAPVSVFHFEDRNCQLIRPCVDVRAQRGGDVTDEWGDVGGGLQALSVRDSFVRSLSIESSAELLKVYTREAFATAEKISEGLSKIREAEGGVMEMGEGGEASHEKLRRAFWKAELLLETKFRDGTDALRGEARKRPQGAMNGPLQGPPDCRKKGGQTQGGKAGEKDSNVPSAIVPSNGKIVSPVECCYEEAETRLSSAFSGFSIDSRAFASLRSVDMSSSVQISEDQWFVHSWCQKGFHQVAKGKLRMSRKQLRLVLRTQLLLDGRGGQEDEWIDALIANEEFVGISVLEHTGYDWVSDGDRGGRTKRDRQKGKSSTQKEEAAMIGDFSFVFLGIMLRDRWKLYTKQGKRPQCGGADKWGEPVLAFGVALFARVFPWHVASRRSVTVHSGLPIGGFKRVRGDDDQYLIRLFWEEGKPRLGLARPESTFFPSFPPIELPGLLPFRAFFPLSSKTQKWKVGDDSCAIVRFWTALLPVVKKQTGEEPGLAYLRLARALLEQWEKRKRDVEKHPNRETWSLPRKTEFMLLEALTFFFERGQLSPRQRAGKVSLLSSKGEKGKSGNQTKAGGRKKGNGEKKYTEFERYVADWLIEIEEKSGGGFLVGAISLGRRPFGPSYASPSAPFLCTDEIMFRMAGRYEGGFSLARSDSTEDEKRIRKIRRRPWVSSGEETGDSGLVKDSSSVDGEGCGCGNAECYNCRGGGRIVLGHVPFLPGDPSDPCETLFEEVFWRDVKNGMYERRPTASDCASALLALFGEGDREVLLEELGGFEGEEDDDERIHCQEVTDWVCSLFRDEVCKVLEDPSEDVIRRAKRVRAEWEGRGADGFIDLLGAGSTPPPLPKTPAFSCSEKGQGGENRTDDGKRGGEKGNEGLASEMGREDAKPQTKKVSQAQPVGVERREAEVEEKGKKGTSAAAKCCPSASAVSSDTALPVLLPAAGSVLAGKEQKEADPTMGREKGTEGISVAQSQQQQGGQGGEANAGDSKKKKQTAPKGDQQLHIPHPQFLTPPTEEQVREVEAEGSKKKKKKKKKAKKAVKRERREEREREEERQREWEEKKRKEDLANAFDLGAFRDPHEITREIQRTFWHFDDPIEECQENSEMSDSSILSPSPLKRKKRSPSAEPPERPPLTLPFQFPPCSPLLSLSLQADPKEEKERPNENTPQATSSDLPPVPVEAAAGLPESHTECLKALTKEVTATSLSTAMGSTLRLEASLCTLGEGSLSRSVVESVSLGFAVTDRPKEQTSFTHPAVPDPDVTLGGNPKLLPVCAASSSVSLPRAPAEVDSYHSATVVLKESAVPLFLPSPEDADLAKGFEGGEREDEERVSDSPSRAETHEKEKIDLGVSRHQSVSVCGEGEAEEQSTEEMGGLSRVVPLPPSLLNPDVQRPSFKERIEEKAKRGADPQEPGREDLPSVCSQREEEKGEGGSERSGRSGSSGRSSSRVVRRHRHPPAAVPEGLPVTLEKSPDSPTTEHSPSKDLGAVSTFPRTCRSSVPTSSAPELRGRTAAAVSLPLPKPGEKEIESKCELANGIHPPDIGAIVLAPSNEPSEFSRESDRANLGRDGSLNSPPRSCDSSLAVSRSVSGEELVKAKSCTAAASFLISDLKPESGQASSSQVRREEIPKSPNSFQRGLQMEEEEEGSRCRSTEAVPVSEQNDEMAPPFAQKGASEEGVPVARRRSQRRQREKRCGVWGE
uniref:Uncharacterized protein n=1 Tax=Chromera velia CCMP2878 TaxID=1169474 RepID=A0A0G4IB76_9ALVE|eukprot:Cvel_12674.t1-p1 / transcript=Cvel_12674.t1 / gene=Cvel_12674 / organism=Chromera_velia_CCMP2878 / gene_product=hypothetical protein / transcript_product=hypothetical protein / location=Cvel_scaffold838:7963-18963(-) / protein_length=2287 / sequence_SO=supercontig / SO=protein_coding / is_pseudo=false